MMKPSTISILGDGSWGTAVALHLAHSAQTRVRLWSARVENGQRLQTDRENKRFLPGVPIPSSITLTTDLQEALDQADLCITAIPTIYLRSTLDRFRSLVPASLPVLSLTKGIENESFLRPSQMIQQIWNSERIAVLSGPSHAEEVARGMPCSVVIAGMDVELTQSTQRLFTTDRFRVYTNTDLIGVELAGALKNVIGIAAGVCDGLGYGDNAKSALLTRGLVEMSRFAVALGAEHATFQGLAGVGDLITTCISPHGRNRRVGERLGRGEKVADILASMPMVAEGVTTSQSVHQRCKQMGLEMPIMQGVYQVLYENKPPLVAVQDLMSRKPRSEQAGA